LQNLLGSIPSPSPALSAASLWQVEKGRECHRTGQCGGRSPPSTKGSPYGKGELEGGW